MVFNLLIVPFALGRVIIALPFILTKTQMIKIDIIKVRGARQSFVYNTAKHVIILLLKSRLQCDMPVQFHIPTLSFLRIHYLSKCKFKSIVEPEADMTEHDFLNLYLSHIHGFS